MSASTLRYHCIPEALPIRVGETGTVQLCCGQRSPGKSHRSIQAGINSSYNDVNAAIGPVRAYHQLTISAESALSATKAGYEVGTRTIVDVLDATKNLYAAKQKLSAARYDFILKQLSLKQLAGNL